MQSKTPTPSGDTALRRFFTGAGLPAFLVTITLFYELFLLAVIFAPEGSGPWSRFAIDFKVWCFSYDPRTGGMEWSAVWMMLLEPVFITGMVLLIWHKALRGFLNFGGWSAQRAPIAGGAAVAAAALGVLYLYGLPEADGGDLPPFPGERIRTSLEPPEFSLTDQKGLPVRLSDLRGQVVVITGVYSHCTTACPKILYELRTLLDDLPAQARRELRIIALSLNPERDTTELMSLVADAYNFTHPEFRFINGDPVEMGKLLTRYQFSPVYNSSTGVIDHANLFILIDAAGRIAYRFNLDPKHAPWLREAVISLAEEAAAERSASAVAGL